VQTGIHKYSKPIRQIETYIHTGGVKSRSTGHDRAYTHTKLQAAIRRNKHAYKQYIQTYRRTYTQADKNKHTETKGQAVRQAGSKAGREAVRQAEKHRDIQAYIHQGRNT